MTRLIVYVVGALASLASVALAAYGLATYDPTTEMLDIAPFHVPTLVAWLTGSMVTAGACITAVVAWLRGWVGRPR